MFARHIVVKSRGSPVQVEGHEKRLEPGSSRIEAVNAAHVVHMTENPGAADPFGDEVDSNCDGSDGVDLDGDSWAGNAPEELRDCNDSEPTTYPGAADTVDSGGVDSNCDGVDGVRRR